MDCFTSTKEVSWEHESENQNEFTTISKCNIFSHHFICTKDFYQVCSELESTLCGQDNSIQNKSAVLKYFHLVISYNHDLMTLTYQS